MKLTASTIDGRIQRTPQCAFTLVELLLVMFIVALLAALLLPVLSKAKGRSRQIECLSQLKQAGVAYQNFAHEHGDRFPFQVPMKEGGTLEFVQAAAGLGGDVQFAFRHFQALSNDLETPKIVACPSDTRTPAPTFAALRNEHVSYFVAVTAEYGKPDSLLGGDRNIVASGGNTGSILRLHTGSEAAWTHECHEYRGNLLFAGGHVERTGKAELRAALLSPAGPVNAWIPVGPSSSGGSSASAAGGGGHGGASGGSVASSTSGRPGSSGGQASGFTALQNFFQSTPNPGTPPSTPPPPSTPAPIITTPAPSASAVPQTVATPPVPETNTVPRQVAAAKPSAPAALSPAAEPPRARDTDSPAGVLGLLTEPGRWWWWVILLLCIAASVTLGALIQRRRLQRQHAAEVAGLFRGRSSRPPAS